VDEEDPFVFQISKSVQLSNGGSGFPVRFRCPHCGGFAPLDFAKDLEEAAKERDVRVATEMARGGEAIVEYFVEEGHAPYELLEQIRDQNDRLADEGKIRPKDDDPD
jgi:hypothetical protein